MLIYADIADLSLWPVTPWPDDPEARIRSASNLVRKATRAARYDVDSAGKPSDPEILATFRDATCAQVQAWAAADIDPSAVAATHTPQVSSKAMGGRSVTYTTASPEVLAERARIAGELCGEAMDILANAGLVAGQPGWR